MCNKCGKTSAMSLQAAIMGALINHGMPVDVALSASQDVVVEFAKSEVAHPQWAANILDEDEDGAQAGQGEAASNATEIEIAPGVKIGVIGYGEDGQMDPAAAANVPEPVRKILGAIVAGIAAARNEK